MKATRQGIRSTKEKEDEADIEVETVNKTDEILEDEPELEPPRPHMERAINHQVACAVRILELQSLALGLVSRAASCQPPD